MKLLNKPLTLISTYIILCTPTHAQETIKRPNIIFLFADDQNTLSVGCYGNPEVQTPNMDKLGAEGIIFDKHYNTTSICMASRANVMTGMYEYKTGTNFNHGNMTPEIWSKSYPILLRKAGYLTAFAGKFGFEVNGYGYNCKEFFDTWGGSPGQTNYKTEKNTSMKKYAKDYPHSTLSYGAFGQDFIKRAVKEEKPFCLSISYKAPHRPVAPDPKFNHIYKGKTFTKPANYGRAAGAHMSPQSKQGRQYIRFHEWSYSDKYDEVMAKYFQQVYAIDVSVGMIRAELAAQGVADNTVIIYTSDNGFICGSHGYGSKVLPMEESSRVPLIIYDPRNNNAGKQLHSTALTANIDFAPTILELAGLPIPSNMDGVSLLPLLKDPKQDIRNEISFINVYGALPTTSLSVITKDWKYSYWWYGDKTMEPQEDLFHLTIDPDEMINHATKEESREILTTMRKTYDRALAHWKTNTTPKSKHYRYGKLFDRNIPWQEKTISKKKIKKEKVK